MKFGELAWSSIEPLAAQGYIQGLCFGALIALGSDCIPTGRAIIGVER